MRMAIAVAVAGVVIGVGRVDAAAQTRFEVGLLLGSTRTTDEGTVLQFDRGTTYQATFAWPVWRSDAAELLRRNRQSQRRAQSAIRNREVSRN